MYWHLIVVAGLIVAVTLFLAAVLFYSNLRGLLGNTQKVLRFRTDRSTMRSTDETDCRG